MTTTLWDTTGGDIVKAQSSLAVPGLAVRVDDLHARTASAVHVLPHPMHS